MTTSGVNTFSVNRDQIIRMAMLNIGKLEGSETPTAQEITDCSLFLNSLVKQWQGTADFAPGLKTWTRRHGFLFLQKTTGTYTVGPSGTGWTAAFNSTSLTAAAAGSQPSIQVASTTGLSTGVHVGVVVSGNLFWSTVLTVVGSNVTLASNLPAAGATSGAVVFSYATAANQPLKIESVFLRDSTSTDVPVRILTQAEYDTLPSKADPNNVSDVGAIYYEFQLGNSVLRTDVAGEQDVTKYLCLTFLEAIEDFVNPTDTPEYPQEWYLALSLGLSKLIAPMFYADWTQVHEDNFRNALAIAQRKEPDRTAAYFQCGEDMA